MEAAITPPKRMTRARAAAKDATSTATTTGATKAATKRATAPTASTAAKATATRTSAKRKTRTDESEEDVQRLREEDDTETGTMNKPASRGRGRAKKIAESKPEPAPESRSSSEPQVDDASSSTTTTATVTKGTRGRAKKPATASTTAAASAAATKPEPAKTTRTRTRKTTTTNTTADAPGATPKKPTRGRVPKAASGIITTTVSTEPTPGLKSAVSRPAGRVASVIKKTVTFQEPEKENMVPGDAKGAKAKTKTAETTATGMRAKPVRKPVTGGRTTRASARATSPEEKKEKKEKTPLSPKKDGQNLPIARDNSSDDELATYEKTPLRRLMKSPVKPPASSRRVDIPPPKEEAGDNQEPSEPAGPSVLGSPARRPPPSPWKDSMKSPAKKLDAVPAFIFSSSQNDNQAEQTPFKPSILQSPAKRPQLPIAAFQLPPQEPGTQRSPVKMSLLQSPAKRPASPIKMLGSPSRSNKNEAKPELDFEQLFGSKPSPERRAPVEEVHFESPQPQPNQPVEDEAATDADHEEEEDEAEEEEQDEEMQLEQQEVSQEAQQQAAVESPAQLEFPGRLSAVLPRHADPALKDKPVPTEASPVEQEKPVVVDSAEPQEEVADTTEKSSGEPMEIDEVETKEDSPADEAASTTPPQSPPAAAANPAFELREKEFDEQTMSESEDELALSAKIASKHQDDTPLSTLPATPTPATLRNTRASLPSSALKAASRAIRSVSRNSQLGFTPLAMQLGEWKASSPMKLVKMEQATSPAGSTDDSLSLVEDKESPANGSSPLKGFFDDEMRIRAEMETQAAIEAALEADIAAKYDDPEFNDMDITHEDVELAAEANEMSLMDTDRVEEMADARAHDDSVSDASQEYGDENAVPIDPAIMDTRRGGRSLSLAPQTPMRPSAPKAFHTVSKVPLKPADDSTPRSVKRRSASASKPSARRLSGFSRNATVISYTPTKDSNVNAENVDESEHPPVTPAKSDIWASMGTPARTPRRDINPTLLRGAVVFVDVHTSEGEDARTIFVDLLTQMGARCVKSWPWNPSSAPNGESTTSKIGITHVVYKDGGKRTLEKVRESGGVVQCVGVSWVLDCERENQWVDERPYQVDTSLIPRGGRNRRKSMEPKALANVNGTLVTPIKPNQTPARDCQTVPNNHMSRRDSTAWVRSPSDRDDDEEDAPAEQEWANDSFLTPVPKTPAPETVARFAMDITPGGADEDDELGDSPTKEGLMMRTCPPKKATFAADLGQGLLRKEKDQSVMMRLMAARRKSLQFAPKIASPLSKAWK